MKIIVFNVGSSSIKFKLFEKSAKDDFKIKKEGQVQSIGEKIPTHKEGLSKLIKENSLDINSIDLIAHRVVHGGKYFKKPTKVNNDVLSKLESISNLAPLHNPPQLKVVKELEKHKADQWLVFDTSLFSDLPQKAAVYPLPYSYYKEGVKKYGFHGISHEYLFKNGAKKLSLDPNKSKVVTLHLGAGASVTAFLNGQPIDNSMGFTPLEGLMMQTRSGDLDPGVIIHLMKEKGMTADDMERVLNNKSGLKGIMSGKFEDMRDILFLAGEKVEDDSYEPTGFDNCSKEDVKRAKLAIEIFTHRVKKYIGAYNAQLNGLDGLVFSGAIGYGSSVIRNKILDSIDNLISKEKACAIKANEELAIAKKVVEFVDRR